MYFEFLFEKVKDVDRNLHARRPQNPLDQKDRPEAEVENLQSTKPRRRNFIIDIVEAICTIVDSNVVLVPHDIVWPRGAPICDYYIFLFLCFFSINIFRHTFDNPSRKQEENFLKYPSDCRI